MQLVLAGLKMLHCPVYVADVIVMGRSFQEHFGNLQNVFEWLRKAGLTFEPTKCVFINREVFCWDTPISRERVSLDPEEKDKVARWNTLQSAKEVQQYLGL